MNYDQLKRYDLTPDEARLILDWFEAAASKALEDGIRLVQKDYVLAGALYKFRGQQPPPRLRHLIPAESPQTLPAGQMHRWLLDHKYTPDDTGAWVSPDVGLDFMPGMWQYCGGTDLGGFKWPPEWFVKG